MNSTLVKIQKKSFTSFYTKQGVKYRITANVRFDDKCGNGHNTFSITADVYRLASNGRWAEDSFGCQHELVSRYFEQLRPFIKWHLTSTDGPTHYIANTIYWAEVASGIKKYSETETREVALGYARSTAVWPDATLEQLLDKSALEARAEGLQAEFKKDMEALGFNY